MPLRRWLVRSEVADECLQTTEWFLRGGTHPLEQRVHMFNESCDRERHTRTGLYPPVTYLLCDDLFIERCDNAHRVICPPEKLPNPVLVPQHPWEGAYVWMHNGLLYDPEERLFKLWYHCQDERFAARHPELRWQDRPAYAVSRDCIHWQKPELRVVKWGGSDRNNLVRFPPYGGSGPLSTVLKDPETNGYLAMGMARFRTPAREKPIYWFDGDSYHMSRKNRGDVPITCGFYVYESADGFVWKRRRKCLMSNTVVTDNMFAHGFDPEMRKWIFWAGARTAGKFRTIGVSFSPDLDHIPFPQEILTPDDQDPPECEFNHLVALKVSGGYAGLVVDFRPREGCKKEPQFVFSRDGRVWQRTAGRSPFIAAGSAGSWDEMNVFVHNPVQRGDDIFLPYHGSITGNGSWFPQREDGTTRYIKVPFWGQPLPDGRANVPGIGLAKLKRDRWTALTCRTSDPSTVVTKRMYWAGTDLYINADARGGTIRAELFDHHRQPIEGYRLADCTPFSSDSLKHQMTWKNRRGLSAKMIGTALCQGSVGRLIGIRFHLEKAKLYTFSC